MIRFVPRSFHNIYSAHCHCLWFCKLDSQETPFESQVNITRSINSFTNVSMLRHLQKNSCNIIDFLNLDTCNKSLNLKKAHYRTLTTLCWKVVKCTNPYYFRFIHVILIKFTLDPWSRIKELYIETSVSYVN